MNVKRIVIYLFSFLTGIRVFPLLILWKFRILCGDNECIKFKEDLLRSKCNFWLAMYLKPQY